MRSVSLFEDERSDEVLDDGQISDATRKAFAVHRSPMGVVRQVVGMLEPLLGPVSRILLPAAGDGRWGHVCREVWPGAHLTAVEPREEEREGLLRFCDVVHTAYVQDIASGLGTFDLVIDNPPFSIKVGGKKSQAEAMRAFVTLRSRLATERSRVVMYWLNDLGARSPGAVAEMEAHCPVEQWRIPLPASHDRNADLRQYSIWHWTRKPRDHRKGWRTITLPMLPKAARTVYEGDFTA